jgi:hypothetical protein
MEESDQLRFGFDLLDPTKMVPEDIVPFTPLGKLTLNRNPRNYFAETEQIMVCSDISCAAFQKANLSVSSSNLVISSAVLTLLRTRSFKEECSRTWTLS